MSKVAIVACVDYDKDRVQAAVDRSLALIGGMEQFIRPGMRVLIKCNLLMKKLPEEAATTHPEVAAALAKAVRKAGGQPIIGDSPGGLYTERALRGVYRACGIEEISRRDGIPLNYDTEIIEVKHPEGKIINNMMVIKLLEEVDAVITVAKLKTHGMALFTGAVKNLFGVIPGMTKAEYHFRMKKPDDFSDMLVDVCTYVKPVLSFMDGIVGMEGDGPSAGDPRNVGVLLAGSSPYALDVAAVSLVGIPPERVKTIVSADKRGLQSSRLEDIHLVGDPIKDLIIRDFKVPQLRSIGFVGYILRGDNRFSALMDRYLGPRPVFSHQMCIGCQDCKKYCPPKAIRMIDKKPVVDLNACIKCYCCQELCPEKAVSIQRSWLFRRFK